MKASELRLGNNIHKKVLDVNTGNYEWCVIEVNYHDLHDLINNRGDYKPIPITEERLLMLGFELCDGWWRKESGRKTMLITLDDRGDGTGGILIGYIYNFSDICILTDDVEYVHQLQNLYFALTGEELTVAKS